MNIFTYPQYRQQLFISMKMQKQFLVPQIEVPLGAVAKRWSCILPVACFLSNTIDLSNCTIVRDKRCSDVTIVQSDVTIVVPWQQSTGSKHYYIFCYCPLVGILFEVVRIGNLSDPTLEIKWLLPKWDNSFRRSESIQWISIIPVISCKQKCCPLSLYKGSWQSMFWVKTTVWWSSWVTSVPDYII